MCDSRVRFCSATGFLYLWFLEWGILQKRYIELVLGFRPYFTTYTHATHRHVMISILCINFLVLKISNEFLLGGEISTFARTIILHGVL